MSVKFTTVVRSPDLVFGLTGPIGVDLDYIQTAIEDGLKSFNYNTVLIRLTDLMQDITSTLSVDYSSLFNTFQTKIAYANDLRQRYDARDILAAVAVSAISRLRKEINNDVELFSFGQAYIIRQLKTPEEVRLLRSVYGRQFIQVSIYGNPEKRLNYLAAKLKMSAKGTLGDADSRQQASVLIDKDRKEDNSYGQNLSNAFPLGDVFVDSADRETATISLTRFLAALFGSNEITPTRDEYGMYLAKSASLRSSDLSRQVGVAIFSESGEIISLGSNEVPRAGGGTYWTGDPLDSRDMRLGHDPNELNKAEIFADLIGRLQEDGFLSGELLKLPDTLSIINHLLQHKGKRDYKSSRVMDLIEFGRVIHAEMSAICDAARNGIAIRRGTLFSTTFPCHLCAKHIVVSGINRVVYLEPYAKSYARQLHSDSLQIEERSDANKVAFEPFIGISPYRYRDLFEKGRRKGQLGEALKWNDEPRRPMIDIFTPVHLSAEEIVISQLGQIIAEMEAKQADR